MREPHLNAARGALYQLLAQGGWQREGDIVAAVLRDTLLTESRILAALDQGVRCGLYHQWLFRGEGCYSDELHYSLRRDYQTQRGSNDG